MIDALPVMAVDRVRVSRAKLLHTEYRDGFEAAG